MSVFRKAERKKSKARIALCSPSGGGKTYSALLMARGIVGDVGKIAVIDTENGSAELYSHVTDFDVLIIKPPFSPERYIHGIKAAEKEGYDVIIIDSLTHAWSGEGGVLDTKDRITKAQRGGNSYTAWREVTPMHDALVNAMLQSDCHIIATIRTKTAYEMQDNDKGKKTPVKIGLAPIQRDGLEYEFTLVFDISVDGHIATASKDRTSLFDGQYEVITVSTGARLADWLNSGADIQPETPETATQAKQEPKPVQPQGGDNAQASMLNKWIKRIRACNADELNKAIAAIANSEFTESEKNILKRECKKRAGEIEFLDNDADTPAANAHAAYIAQDNDDVPAMTEWDAFLHNVGNCKTMAQLTNVKASIENLDLSETGKAEAMEVVKNKIKELTGGTK